MANSSWGKLCISQDQGQAHAQEQAQHPGPEHRQGAVGIDHLAQVHNLTTRDSRASIHEGSLFSDLIGLKA